jgi:hypothetical protein
MWRKSLFTKKLLALLLFGVFLFSFSCSYLAISLTPYGYVTERVYSKPQASANNEPSAMGGAFLGNQILYLMPEAGSTNVSRDTAIWIDEPRPVRVENIRLSPEVAISRTDKHYPPASVAIAVYPSELLQPNTTYNVSAVVADTPSWWSFTTSPEPNQYKSNTYLNPSVPWIALAIAITTTFGVFLVWRSVRNSYNQKTNFLGCSSVRTVCSLGRAKYTPNYQYLGMK